METEQDTSITRENRIMQMRFDLPDLMKDQHEQKELEKEINELEPYFACKLNLAPEKSLNSPIELGGI